MEWRGGNHIVPIDFRNDHLPEEADDMTKAEFLLVRQAILQVLDDHEWQFYDPDTDLANSQRVDFADCVQAWLNIT